MSIIVIDNGSGFIKAGFSGEDAPRVKMPCLTGTPRAVSSYLNFNPKCYYGEEALSQRGMVTLNQPIKYGIIENFDDMEKIWYNIIVDKLKTTSEEHRILLSEHILNPKKNREKTTEIMFEQLKVPSMSLINDCILDLTTTNRITGVVLDCGYSGTTSVCIKDGMSQFCF